MKLLLLTAVGLLAQCYAQGEVEDVVLTGRGEKCNLSNERRALGDTCK